MTSSYDPVWDGFTVPRSHWHFYAKVFQRYNHLFHPGEYRQLVDKIESGKAIMRRSNVNERPGIHEYVVTLHHQHRDNVRLLSLYVVYETRRKRFITALTKPHKRVRDMYLKPLGKKMKEQYSRKNVKIGFDADY